MSLVRFAVRQCAARSLRGATLAEGRVWQSVIDPISAKVSSERAPVLIVNTDDHKQDGAGRDITGGDAQLELVIEAAIAAKVTTTGRDGDGDEVAVTIIEADSGLDLTLDILEHQVIRAMIRPGVWPDLLRRFVPKVHSRTSRRGADAQGTRWAARQIVFTCDTLAEPVGGEALAPGAVWGDFIAAMESEPELSVIAPLIRGVIEGDADDWARSAAMLGIGQETDIGAAPFIRDDDGAPVILDEVELIEGDRL